MAFQFVKGRTILRSYPRTASVTMTKGDLVIFTSGLLATATAGDNAATVVGIIQKSVASTDSDFATSAVAMLVECPADSECELVGPVANGTLLTTSVGVKFGLTSAGAVDFADTSNTDLECVAFISGTQGRFQLLTGARHNN